MSSTSATPSPSDWQQWMPKSPFQPLSYALVVFMTLLVARYFSSPGSGRKGLPFINPPKGFASQVDARRDFLRTGKTLMERARALWPNKPYWIITDVGEMIMLPPSFADEIRNNPDLSFSKAVYNDFHGGIRGFEPPTLTGPDFELLRIVVRKQLTKLLEFNLAPAAQVTEPLAAEAAHAMAVNLGDSTEWKEMRAQPVMLDIIARLSSRVFLGEELCRNDRWLRITKQYTMTVFSAVFFLRVYPRPLRWLVSWFLPQCKKLRAEFAEAHDTVVPVVEKRRRLRAEAKRAGKPMPQFNDALDWADQEAAALGATCDPAIFQLTLSVAAIHTSTDLLTQIVLDLAQHPEIIEPLRTEIAAVLKADGWKKTSLYNMKLLDSVMKESQRMKPIGLSSMRRYAMKDITLSSGLFLKKGERIMVDGYRMRDPALHENPDQWDGYRFLKLRAQPGRENMAQMVSTSSDHIAFGHGEHACPGRFFAANEIKVALCHLLMKYDWKLAPGANTQPMTNGTANGANQTAAILIRKRETTELDIDSI